MGTHVRFFEFILFNFNGHMALKQNENKMLYVLNWKFIRFEYSIPKIIYLTVGNGSRNSSTTEEVSRFQHSIPCSHLVDARKGIRSPKTHSQFF